MHTDKPLECAQMRRGQVQRDDGGVWPLFSVIFVGAQPAQAVTVHARLRRPHDGKAGHPHTVHVVLEPVPEHLQRAKADLLPHPGQARRRSTTGKTRSGPTHGTSVSCSHCWRTFDDRLALDAHKRESHREQLAQDGIKRCDLCPALFDLDGSRRMHSITVHGLNERRRVWECIVCGEPFTKVSTFVGHLAEHAPMANYVCCIESCAEQFETIARLDEHLRNHTAPPVAKRKCDACEKTYSEVTFPDHRCRPANAMRMCDYCGKQYAASAFSAHLKTHRATARTSAACSQRNCGAAVGCVGIRSYIKLRSSVRATHRPVSASVQGARHLSAKNSVYTV